MEAPTIKQEEEITIKVEPNDTPDSSPNERQLIAPVRIKEEEIEIDSPPVKRKSIAPVKINEVDESNEEYIEISPSFACRTDYSSSVFIQVTQAVNDDPDVPNLSKETMTKLIKHLNFNYATRSGKSILVDRPEIISWRQKYLNAIKQCRREGRFIYYQNKTWINSEPTTGLRNATGKEKRMMVSHIGGEKGFIDGGLLVLQSKEPVDYHVHADFNAKCFEEWFAGILQKLETNSVVVIDNAPYNSRKKYTIPKMTWKKEKIQEWMNNENIAFKPDMVKATLLDIIKQKYEHCEEYAVDEMAKEFGITALRLPPYHCELNLMEFIWNQVKVYIARHTNKLQNVTQLLHEGIRSITEETWRVCIAQVKREEEKMRRLDFLIDKATDTFTIRSSSDSDSES